MASVEADAPNNPFVPRAEDHPTAQVTELHAVLRRGDVKATLLERGFKGQLRQSTLRSLWWRCMLGCLACDGLSGEPGQTLEAWLQHAQRQRGRYYSLRNGVSTSASSADGRPSDPNPSHNGQPHLVDDVDAGACWAGGTAADQIQKDLCRLFLDDATSAFLQSAATQQALATALGVWAAGHPTPGYQQGMHEVLAVLYLTVVRDAQRRQRETQLVGPAAADDGFSRLQRGLGALLAVEHCEADAFALFDSLVHTHGLGQWFTAVRPGRRPRPPAAPGAEEPSAVVGQCRRIQHELLPGEAPRLAEHLLRLELEPQVYALKWLRLLFLRDFPLEDTLLVWDAIFADAWHTGALTLVPWLAVVLLLYMEQDLLASGEYDYCVKRLMASRHVEGTDYFLWEAIQLAHPDGLPFLGRLPAPKVSHYHPLVVRKRAKAVQLNLFEEAPEAEVNGATKHFQIAETASGEFYFGEQGPPTDAPPRPPPGRPAAAPTRPAAAVPDFFRDDSEGEAEPPLPTRPPASPEQVSDVAHQGGRCVPAPKAPAVAEPIKRAAQSLFDDSDEDPVPTQDPSLAMPLAAAPAAPACGLAAAPHGVALFEDSGSDIEDPKPSGSPPTPPPAPQPPAAAAPPAVGRPPAGKSLFEDSDSDPEDRSPGVWRTVAPSNPPRALPRPSLFDDDDEETVPAQHCSPSNQAVPGGPAAVEGTLLLSNPAHCAACRALVGSPDLSDVQLALDDGTQVPAHRLFLMLGSPALRRRLERLRPGEALAMPGCSRAGLLKGLEVLYTGRVAIPEVDGPLVKEVAQALGMELAEGFVAGAGGGGEVGDGPSVPGTARP